MIDFIMVCFLLFLAVVCVVWVNSEDIIKLIAKNYCSEIQIIKKTKSFIGWGDKIYQIDRFIVQVKIFGMWITYDIKNSEQEAINFVDNLDTLFNMTKSEKTVVHTIKRGGK